MKSFDPRSLLARPKLHEVFRRLVTTGAGRGGIVADYFKPRRGDSVLDIGCGTADVLDDLPEVRYLGIDVDATYIELARACYGDRGTFVHAPITRDAVAGQFDLILAIGVLHHLADEEAGDIFVLARSVVKPTGRLVTVDPCYHSDQSALRRFVVSLDRGRFVRTVDEYERMARREFSVVATHLRTGLVRIPYSHAILECTP